MQHNRRRFLQVTAAAAVDPSRKGRHFVYEFRGTPAEVGFQHGRALRAEIIAEALPSAENLARRSGLAVEAAVAQVVSRYEGLYREHMPGVLDEVRGIAEGARVSYPFAFWAAFRDGMNAEGCTSLVCSGKAAVGGGVIIGQTKDTSAPLERFRIMRIAYASGRRMVILNYPGWMGNLPLTSDGLCFTGNSLHAAPNPGKAVPGSFLKRLIMERQSVRHILDEIRGMTFHNSCILIADRNGHAVCLEMAAGRVDVRDVSGTAFGHANNILAKPLLEFEKKGWASSPFRQKRVDALLKKRSGSFTAATAREIFRDHENFPLSICRHPSAEDPIITNAAFVADLKALRMHIAVGNPCVAGFQTYELPV